MEQAERARAAEQAAQRNAAARAAAAAAETQRLTEDRIAAAARLRQAEAATADAAARMDELAARRREAQASLAARAETMQPLLPLIERLSLFPAETLLAVPARAEDTLRGVLVLRGLAGQLGQEAVALRREQASLAAATGALEAEAPRLAAALAAQQSEAAALDRQIAAAETGRRQADGEVAAAAQRAANEAARAETLRGVLVELDAQRRSRAGAGARGGRRDSVRPTSSDRPAPARSPARRNPVASSPRRWRAPSSAPGATPPRAGRPPASRIAHRRRRALSRRVPVAWRSLPHSAATGCC